MSTVKSPFVKLWVVSQDTGEDIDISDKISRFVFEDSVAIDNMVEFTIIPKYTEVIVEDSDVVEGATIKFQYGYIGGATSVIRSAVIKDVEPDFKSTVVKLMVRALDKGRVLKNTTSNKVWINLKSTDIAKAIADRHKLKVQVDVTTRVWEYYPQGNLDDLTFLRKLADEEQAGNYIVYIQDDTLFFVRRGLDTASRVTITFGQGNNGLIGFKPRYRESTAPTEGAGSSIVSFDFENKKTVVAESKPENEEENITLDDYDLLYSDTGDFIAEQTNTESVNPDAVGNDFGESGLPDIIETGKKIMDMATNPDEVAAKVNSAKKSGTFKVLEGSLRMQGTPNLKPNEIITLKRFFTKYSGNWLIEKIRHEIQGGASYISTLTINKNGSKKPSSKNTAVAKVSNKTRGAEETQTNDVGQDDIILLEFDANSNRTADITQSGAYVPPQDI